MTANRRQFSRIQFHSAARLAVQGREWPVAVLDLSLKGALIGTGNAFTAVAGTPAVLAVALNETGTAIRMAGVIAHQADGHLGLVCHEIDLDSITHLRRLVELNLGDEALLERELAHLSAD